MKNALIITMLFAGILIHAEEEVTFVSQTQFTSHNVKKEPNVSKIINGVTVTYDLQNKNRIKNSRIAVDGKNEIDDQGQAELREIVYLIQEVYLSPLSKARKDKIITTLEMAVFARSKPYKGSAGVYLLSLVSELTNEDAKITCIEFATKSYSDVRCVKALCGLLCSDEYSPSDRCRLKIYRSLMDWASNSELIECFKKEYSKNIPEQFKYDLAVQLAWCGDSTGAPTLIERLDANADNLLIRTAIRATLVKLYSVDLGDDTEAWKKLVEKGKDALSEN